MIEARDVTVFLGGKRIVHNADFDARPGELVSIVGPNGSGKTTFMRALAGDLPYTGEIDINGRPLSALKPWHLAGMRAVLPQSTTLSFPFTVHEVVRLGLTGGRSGALPGENERLPERALAKVDLEGFAGRFYQELSGGEQQRVQLARVLCQVWAPVLEGQPRWLFLDEPISSLDIKHQLVIMRIAREFATRGGGVIAILHDLNLASMFSDKIMVLHRGRTAATGTPQEVLSDGLMSRVFECDMKVGVPPVGVPFVLPQSVAR
jgi:iron complex transport system ATP-binding protein